MPNILGLLARTSVRAARPTGIIAFVLVATIAARAEAQQQVAFNAVNSTVPGESGIYLISASGGAVSPLVTGNDSTQGSLKTNPYLRWYPDGSSLVFKATRVGVTSEGLQLYSVIASSRATTRITNKKGLYAVRGTYSLSSQTGAKRIAFVGEWGNGVSSDTYEIDTIPATGGTIARGIVYPDNGGATNSTALDAPRYSPDNATIAYLHLEYVNGQPTQIDISTVPAGGGSKHILDPGPLQSGDLAWAPSGVYLAAITAAGDVVTVNATTGAVTNLTNGAYGSCSSVAISPNSVTIAAQCSCGPLCGSNLGVVLFPSAGGSGTVVASDASGWCAPSWSSDGQLIAYSYYAGWGNPGVAVVNVTTGMITQLTAPDAYAVDGVAFKP
jgi:WD40 repeat protein